jgi:hypothetical protein
MMPAHQKERVAGDDFAKAFITRIGPPQVRSTVSSRRLDAPSPGTDEVTNSISTPSAA